MYHDCAISCCGERIPTSMLMCRKHWRMVPRPIQTRVNDAWWLAPDMRCMESAEYMSARQDAIDAVVAKLRLSTGNVSRTSEDSSQNPRDARGGEL